MVLFLIRVRWQRAQCSTTSVLNSRRMASKRRCRLRSGFSAVLIARRKMSINHSRLYWYIGSTFTEFIRSIQISKYIGLQNGRQNMPTLQRSAITKNIAELRTDTGTSEMTWQSSLVTSHELVRQLTNPMLVFLSPSFGSFQLRHVSLASLLNQCLSLLLLLHSLFDASERHRGRTIASK